jgi:hypothetical protein
MSQRTTEFVASCEHSNETSGSIESRDFWLAERLLASDEGLCSTDLANKSFKKHVTNY